MPAVESVSGRYVVAIVERRTLGPWQNGGGKEVRTWCCRAVVEEQAANRGVSERVRRRVFLLLV